MRQSEHRGRISSTTLALGGLVVAAGLTVVGLVAFEHFFEHVLAEGIGIAASVPITVVVIEAILDRRRREQWAEVRVQTAKSIQGLAQQFAVALAEALPAECRSGLPGPRVMPAGGHAASLQALAVKTRGLASNEVDSEPMRAYQALSPLIYALVDRMSLRVYASGDIQLIALFGDVEEQSRALDYSVTRYHDTPQAPEIWASTADTACAIAELANYVGLSISPTAAHGQG